MAAESRLISDPNLALSLCRFAILRACGYSFGVTLTFDVPDSLLQEIHLPPATAQAEVTKEVALALYARGLLSIGRASEFSGVTRPEFEALLAQRRVERPYDLTELERDLAWAKGAQ